MYYSSSQSRSLELRRPQNESKNVYAALGLETDIKNKSSSTSLSHQRQQQQSDVTSSKRSNNLIFKVLCVLSILFYMSNHVANVMNKISSTYQNLSGSNENIDSVRTMPELEQKGMANVCLFLLSLFLI